MTTNPNPMLTAALAAAARGWPVFPCAPGAKRPAVDAWNSRATRDPDRIRACWNSTGGARFNIGIACGPAGLVVLDADTTGPDETHPDGRLTAPGWTGLDALNELAVDRPLPATFSVETPSGGRHLYYRAPTGPGAVELRNTAGALGWKLDTRAVGGYVLAAGSHLAGVGPYRPVPDAPHEVSELPQWLAEALRPPPPPPTPPAPRPVALEDAGADACVRVGRYLDAAIRAETDRVTRAHAGTRNRALYIAAVALGQLAAGGTLTNDDVTGVLLDACAGHVANGAYSPGQARATITSGLRAGARRPRTLPADPAGGAGRRAGRGPAPAHTGGGASTATLERPGADWGRTA